MPRIRLLRFTLASFCLLLALELSSSFLTAADDTGLNHFPKLKSDRDWPWWRGPSRNGIATNAAPVNFSAADGYVWKASVPGRGHSSPIVVGNRVFLTTADE